MQLPIDNEPLVLADGTKIDPTTGKVIKDKPTEKYYEVPSNGEAQKIVARTRRTIGELPHPPKQLSAVALVAFYTLYGLTDTDICIALDNKLTVEQIKNIREQEAYKEFMVTAKENILHTETNTVRELFEQKAITAARRITELAESDVDVLAFKASQDVLDRAGHRPADIVEHRHKMEDSLNIVITHKTDREPDLPMIDVTPVGADNE
jgi:hypothetical protein